MQQLVYGVSFVCIAFFKRCFCCCFCATPIAKAILQSCRLTSAISTFTFFLRLLRTSFLGTCSFVCKAHVWHCCCCCSRCCTCFICCYTCRCICCCFSCACCCAFLQLPCVACLMRTHTHTQIQFQQHIGDTCWRYWFFFLLPCACLLKSLRWIFLSAIFNNLQPEQHVAVHVCIYVCVCMRNLAAFAILSLNIFFELPLKFFLIFSFLLVINI